MIVPSSLFSDSNRSRHRMMLHAVVAAALLLAAVWFGRRYGHVLPELENWIASHGAFGWIVFICIVVVLTSLYLPESLFAVSAGILFGVAAGTIIIIVAALLTASLNFTISRLFLRNRVQAWLHKNPKFSAIERAVNNEGLRIQLLLRLSPIHPVTCNYVLGATNTSFYTFIVGCLGLIPGLFVEVYFGVAAKHVTHLAGNTGAYDVTHSILILSGLSVCIILMVYITHLTRRTISRFNSQK